MLTQGVELQRIFGIWLGRGFCESKILSRLALLLCLGCRSHWTVWPDMVRTLS